ncbi:hypothetical protein [Pseudomonas sp. stari2]|uniref:hypothetical protein n=1 Tax=Pseudomonas sp. Stari2 TaxID=2954814 RepID=UPI00345DA430
MSQFIHRAFGHFLMNESVGDGGGALTVDGGAAAFAALLEPPAATEQEQGAEEHEEQAAEPEVEAEQEQKAETGEQESEQQTFTVKIDGKEVEVPLSELLNGYQRQSDYTKKTMEAAEVRKAADAETQKAQQERQQYHAELQRMAVQLEGVLEQQGQIDWDALRESDPMEYLKQQHLFQKRHALYQQNIQEQQQLAQQFQHEQAQAHQSYLAQQRDDLLAKLPDWKDEAKAVAEKTAISKFLQEQGFGDEDISSITDHRHVIVARKAMLYDQLMANAKVQAKKVQEAPQRVVKPGVTSTGTPDGRTTAMKRLEKSGRVEDAAAVFASIL